jgi:hypothetical protein
MNFTPFSVSIGMFKNRIDACLKDRRQACAKQEPMLLKPSYDRLVVEILGR